MADKKLSDEEFPTLETASMVKQKKSSKKKKFHRNMPSANPNDSVKFSKSGKSAAFEFHLPVKLGHINITKEEVNERAGHISKQLSKSGQYFDVYDISRKLCEHFGVTSVQDLPSSGYKFHKELDIPAIKEFSMKHRKVLCLIHAYCTSATVATLHDLRDFICKTDEKETFEQLKLGPLEKFPLITHYFQFPPDKEIPALTATQVVKKTKFHDRAILNEAQEDLKRNMNDDLDKYIRSLRKGLTGRSDKNTPGQPVNEVQRIAGMPIDQCIINIFTFADRLKKSLQRTIINFPLLYSLEHIGSLMMSLSKSTLLCKFFHVIVATGTFQKIGMDDLDLLKKLGFEDSVKKMTIERAIEVLGGNQIMSGDQHDKTSHRKLFINKGELVDEIKSWLEKADKPINVGNLSMIEMRVVQSLNASCFADFGYGSLLAFISELPDVQAAVGPNVVVAALDENDVEDTRQTRQEVAAFALQCRSKENEGNLISSIRKQFDFARKWPKQRIMQLLISSQNEALPNNRKVTYLHVLDCGYEASKAEEDNEFRAFSHLTKDDATQCLQSAPLLENLATWSCWNTVFEPRFGQLKSFLKSTDSVYAVETPTNQLLKISLDSTVEDLSCAIIAGDAQEAAGHLVSIICANDNVSESPLIHIANKVKFALMERIGQSQEGFSVTRFVLECILKIPVTFCCTLANQIFLHPLRELVGDGFGLCPVEARLLQECRSAEEASFLHHLGILMLKEDWRSDFLKNRFKRPETVEPAAEPVKDRRYGPEEDRKANDANHVTRNNSQGDWDDVSRAEDPKSIDKERSSSLISENSDFNDEEMDSKTSQLLARDEQCRALIENIRRSEFGIGEILEGKESELLRKNNERLCRSLDRLSTELYSKDTHFVLELIQNSDDNSYDESLMGLDSEQKPSVAFIVNRDNITVLNNELGFQDSNIKAICDVGKSTKGAHRKGYIGQKGIGFKSVFRVTNSPEIHSNGFQIRFDVSKNKIGYICPQWIDDVTIGLKDYQPPIQHRSMDINWNTRISLPLKEEMAKSMTTGARFQDIHPTLLLFLNRIKVIIIDNRVDGKCLVMEKKICTNNRVELIQNGLPSVWFVVSKEIKINFGDEEKLTDISLAFPLYDFADSSMTSRELQPQKVFAFLPLRSYGFKFLIQADFEVPSSREDINRDSAWNMDLLREIPQLVVDAFFKFRDGNKGEDDMDMLYAAAQFFQYLPLAGETLGVFRPVSRTVIQLLRNEDCMPIYKGDTVGEIVPNAAKTYSECNTVAWSKPSEVLFGDSMLRTIISPFQLQKYLNLNFISDYMQANVNRDLLRDLGVQSETVDSLIEICKSHLKAESEVDAVRWTGKWLLCVSQFLEKQFDASAESRQKIRSIAVFPLTNGDRVKLEGGNVFFPLENNTQNTSDKGDYKLVVEKDLNTLDRQIFHDLDNIGELKLKRFLSELGVKEFSPIEVIKSHVLPTLKSGKWQEKEHVVVPFLMYIKQQYFIDRSAIDIEELKDAVVIKTNQGMTKPSQQQIYFTPSYGNQLNLKETFSSVNWFLLDPVYVKGRKEEDKRSWREFFAELGIDDMPRMKPKRELVAQDELASSPWGLIRPNWPNVEGGSYHISDFVCPELEQVLDSGDHPQLFALAEVLDRDWKKHFAQCERVAVRDAKGREIVSTSSSFLIKLKSKSWLPGVGCEGPGLFKPNQLYQKTVEVQSLLAGHCTYINADLKGTAFANAVGIRHTIQLSTVLDALNKWSQEDSFSTTLEHMKCIYKFINDHIKEVEDADLSKPIIFVPSSRWKSGNSPCKGKFLSKGQVCLRDETNVMYRHASLLKSNRQILAHTYPKEVLGFFECMKVDMTPTLRDYIDLTIALAESTSLPDINAYNDLMALFSCIGRKCVSQQHEEDYLDIVKSKDTTWECFASLDGKFDGNLSSFAYENLKTEQIIPTKNDSFSAPEEEPLLADDRKIAKKFEKEPSILFVDLKVLSKTIESKAQSEETKKDVLKRRLHGVGVLAFMVICRVKAISHLFVQPEVQTENSYNGCPYWHKAFSKLLPYAQRYLRSKSRDAYDELLKAGFAERLKKLLFFTANTITAIHTLKGKDGVSIKSDKKCAHEVIGETTYFHISRDAMLEKEEIIAELVGLFKLDDQSAAENCQDFLVLLESKLDNERNLARYVEKKELEELHEDEQVWELRESENLNRFEATTECSPFAENGCPSQTPTCWPPRPPEIIPKNHSSHEGTPQTHWPPLALKEHTFAQYLPVDNQEQPKRYEIGQYSASPTATTEASQTAQNTTMAKVEDAVEASHMNVEQQSGQTKHSQPGETKAGVASASGAMPKHPHSKPNAAASIGQTQVHEVKPSHFEIADHEIEAIQTALSSMQIDRIEMARCGEEIVWNRLKQEYASDEYVVTWLDEKQPSGLPYDISITARSTGRPIRYIEVKSSTKANKNLFEISLNELKQATDGGEVQYDLYRVSGLSADEQRSLCCFPDLIQHIKMGALKILLYYQADEINN